MRKGKDWALQFVALAELLGHDATQLPGLMDRVEIQTGISVTSTCREHIRQIAASRQTSDFLTQVPCVSLLLRSVEWDVQLVPKIFCVSRTFREVAPQLAMRVDFQTVRARSCHALASWLISGCHVLSELRITLGVDEQSILYAILYRSDTTRMTHLSVRTCRSEYIFLSRQGRMPNDHDYVTPHDVETYTHLAAKQRAELLEPFRNAAAHTEQLKFPCLESLDLAVNHSACNLWCTLKQLDLPALGSLRCYLDVRKDFTHEQTADHLNLGLLQQLTHLALHGHMPPDIAIAAPLLQVLEIQHAEKSAGFIQLLCPALKEIHVRPGMFGSGM